MIHQKYVDEYISAYKAGKIKLNHERVMLLNYLEKFVLSNDQLFFNEEKIDDYIKFTEKWFFPTVMYQRFLAAFVFLYDSTTNDVYYDEHFWVVGRGAGKNGTISSLAAYLVSPLNNINGYNGSIVANSEDQAKTSITEIYNVVQANSLLSGAFKANKSQIESKGTHSVVTYQTSNGKTKDGLRDGFDVFDEIHMYPDDSGVAVYESGLGKVPESRQFEIGSDGYVRDGYLDQKKEIALQTMRGELPPDTMFPFWCKLDDESEVDNEAMWEKANPMLSKPLSGYGKTLFRKIRKQYLKMQSQPSMREEFLTKRMDLPLKDPEKSVAPYEQVKATNRPLPYDKLAGREAIGSLDFASMRDFAACGLTFKIDGQVYFISHQFARKQFVDKYYGYSANPADRPHNVPPISDWEDQGLLTIVNSATIDPRVVVNWFTDMRVKYLIEKVVLDNFRADLLRKFFEDADFEVDVIKNPTAIDGLLAPRIEDGFAAKKFVWGNNPLLRWNTQNVLVTVDARGNKKYGKKEERRRKTDGFKAFEYGQFRVSEIEDVDPDESLDLLNGLNF
ncbi:terminase TerL endonuclease subunit [Lactiplantibacillus plantarum]|uniref:terminase TerL endonuclease subunit n=1 Tax=Lactiplantibacillus plantarum TaxID=1590 RepID=UPI003965C6C4